jgi:hypothetical protein
MADRDYLIMVFPFVSTERFPVLMPALRRNYRVAFSQLDRHGRGYIVLRARHPAGGK